jgi:hypothetical protein
MSKVIAALAAVEQVEAVRLAAAGGLPTRYAYGELWDRRGMDLQVTLLRIFSPVPPRFTQLCSSNLTPALGIDICLGDFFYPLIRCVLICAIVHSTVQFFTFIARCFYVASGGDAGCQPPGRCLRPRRGCLRCVRDGED